MRSGGAGPDIARAIECLLQSGSLVGLDEEELLAQLVQRRDARAFEAIVSRHGPMVLAVCSQLLRDSNDVQDAFQATFLVLIRKGGSVRRPGSLAAWLHGVAYRIALRAKRSPRAMTLLDDQAAAWPPCPTEEREKISVLHQEIERLPEKYRLPIVLCYLEGMTHDDAAAHLQWPVGTVRGRLARARDQLREQLTRRGVSLSLGITTAMDAIRLDRIPLSETQTQATIRLLESTLSSRVANLVQGALIAMMIEKTKWLVLTLVSATLILFAVGSGLRAVAKPGQRITEPLSTTQANPEVPKQSESTKPLAQTRDPVARADEIDETKADTLELQRVKAEVLEMETEVIRKTIQRYIANSGPEIRAPEEGLSEEDRKKREEYRGVLENKAQDLQDTYTEKRLKLARLKRQIARGSRSIEQSVMEKPDLAEMSQRLHTLESKVDRILEALSKIPR
jgi:RNA polymerase sigma factor (sigma-70 family)